MSGSTPANSGPNGPSIITPAPPPATRRPTELEKWSDQAVKHLSHQFRRMQARVRDYSQFIFASKGFKPQQVLDALGTRANEVLAYLQAEAKCVSGLLDKPVAIVPPGFVLQANADGSVTVISSPVQAKALSGTVEVKAQAEEDNQAASVAAAASPATEATPANAALSNNGAAPGGVA